MSARRLGFGGLAALTVGLALALLLASEARAGIYRIAQCGWYVGADADWADSTGGAKFRPDAYCLPAAGGDPLNGVHLKSFTRGGAATVSGTRFARWRWVAPPGTGIIRMQGTWWHALHDGLEQRIGIGTPAGGFQPYFIATATNVSPRGFVADFPPMPAIEDRLLCARGADKWCSLERDSWSGLRALTITVQDDVLPGATIGGELLAGGWRRGIQSLTFWAADAGAGVRFSETALDGVRVGRTDHPCQVAYVEGEWRGIQMRPCPLEAAGTHSVPTTAFGDGAHWLFHCAADFASNLGCPPARQVLIDNHPPTRPRSVRVAGGEGWRRENLFRLAWTNPGQGPASPLAGAGWRLTGPGGHDTGARFAPGRDRASLPALRVPEPGAYALSLWLRDEAGNEAPAEAASVPLRFDPVAPGVVFETATGEGLPDRLLAIVSDRHSGPAGGAIHYRRVGAERWTELVTKLLPGEEPGTARLAAPLPGLAPGTYQFRAEALDGAGNITVSTRRGDGTEMALRVVAPALVPRARSRLRARLHGGRGRADSATIRFGAKASLGGRLTRADGAGLAGRELRVVSRPSRGSPRAATTAVLRTGPRGGFRLPLPAGPSRRLTVAFDGDGGFEPARRAGLALRVRAGVTLRARPPRLRTGQALRLSGRVRTRGAAVPRRGKLVAIQYREAATGRWRPVLVTRGDHRGRFRARYRFRYVSGRSAIRLRATALAEERWPYAPGSSRAVVVRVSG